RRGGRTKAKQSPPPSPAPLPDQGLTEAEQALAAKYPMVDIKPGSLRPGASEGWGNKKIVTIRCASCNAERILATSDLFHCCLCSVCSKQARKEARQARKEGAE